MYSGVIDSPHTRTYRRPKPFCVILVKRLIIFDSTVKRLYNTSSITKENAMPSPRRVSQILKGKKPPKPKTVNAMAKRAAKKKK
jgi:hypothetical protein